jgi:hypothetical protein
MSDPFQAALAVEAFNTQQVQVKRDSSPILVSPHAQCLVVVPMAGYDPSAWAVWWGSQSGWEMLFCVDPRWQQDQLDLCTKLAPRLREWFAKCIESKSLPQLVVPTQQSADSLGSLAKWLSRVYPGSEIYETSRWLSWFTDNRLPGHSRLVVIEKLLTDKWVPPLPLALGDWLGYLGSGPRPTPESLHPEDGEFQKLLTKAKNLRSLGGPHWAHLQIQTKKGLEPHTRMWGELTRDLWQAACLGLGGRVNEDWWFENEFDSAQRWFENTEKLRKEGGNMRLSRNLSPKQAAQGFLRGAVYQQIEDSNTLWNDPKVQIAKACQGEILVGEVSGSMASLLTVKTSQPDLSLRIGDVLAHRKMDGAPGLSYRVSTLSSDGPLVKVELILEGECPEALGLEGEHWFLPKPDDNFQQVKRLNTQLRFQDSPAHNQEIPSGSLAADISYPASRLAWIEELQEGTSEKAYIPSTGVYTPDQNRRET